MEPSQDDKVNDHSCFNKAARRHILPSSVAKPFAFYSFFSPPLRCGGICYPQPGGGCIIRLSEPLLRLRPSWELKNTLIHEMIHAWLIGRGISEGNGGHGRQFNAKCQDINASTVPDFQVLTILSSIEPWQACQIRLPAGCKLGKASPWEACMYVDCRSKAQTSYQFYKSMYDVLLLYSSKSKCCTMFECSCLQTFCSRACVKHLSLQRPSSGYNITVFHSMTAEVRPCTMHAIDNPPIQNSNSRHPIALPHKDQNQQQPNCVCCCLCGRNAHQSH